MTKFRKVVDGRNLRAERDIIEIGIGDPGFDWNRMHWKQYRAGKLHFYIDERPVSLDDFERALRAITTETDVSGLSIAK
jgi:hypothetical protein